MSSNILVSIRSPESLKPDEVLSYYLGREENGYVNYFQQVRELSNGQTQVRVADETEWKTL